MKRGSMAQAMYTAPHRLPTLLQTQLVACASAPQITTPAPTWLAAAVGAARLVAQQAVDGARLDALDLAHALRCAACGAMRGCFDSLIAR